MKKSNTYSDSEFLSHFSKGYNQEIRQYATDVQFLKSRYLFVYRKGKKQFGYCTHCHAEYETKSSLRHNDGNMGGIWCQKCKSEVTVKSEGMGRKYMIDEVYFVFYEKSLINPQAIVARGIHAVRDYRYNFRNVITKFLTCAFYLFEPGNPIMLKQYGYYSHTKSKMVTGNMYPSKSVYSLGKLSPFAGITARQEHDFSADSVHAAVQGTKYQYSTYQEYNDSCCYLKFFELFSKYPCIEYFTKLGLDDLVNAKLYGWNTCNAINWRGKSFEKILKINKKDLQDIKAANVKIDPLFLRLFQIARQDGSNISINSISRFADNVNYKDLSVLLKYTTLEKVYNVTQVRGKNNCNCTKEVEAFITEFKAQKLQKKSKPRIRVPA